jgi:ribonuclease D
MLVVDQEGFAALLGVLSSAEAYAVDAEFHGESSYYPRLAVLQLAVPGQVAVVDATAVDVSALRTVLDGRGLMVAHAGEQDLQVLQRATGTIPARMLDTQIAAGFLGFGCPSLAKLVSEVLGVRLEKGARTSDWFARPLSAAQIGYAAADVTHLLELRSAIEERLVAAGRLAWAYEESERHRRAREADIRTAWWRVKGARQLRGRSRGVAQEVAAWRETAAMTADRPARRILADEVVLLLAERSPGSVREMPSSRLFDPRRLSSKVTEELLAAVARGRDLPPGELRLPPESDLASHLQPLAALLAAWVAQQSRDLSIDAALLATRSDIEAFLRRVPDNPLERGWRAELVGATAGRIVAGRAAVAYDGTGRLVVADLERRPP